MPLFKDIISLTQSITQVRPGLRRCGLRSRLAVAMQARVDSAFAELEKLAKPRNLVAHNGPMFHMHKIRDGEGYELRHELRSSRDPTKDITIEELEKQQAAAFELSDELALIYGLVRQPENQIKGPVR